MASTQPYSTPAIATIENESSAASGIRACTLMLCETADSETFRSMTEPPDERCKQPVQNEEEGTRNMSTMSGTRR